MTIPELIGIHSYEQIPIVTIVEKDDQILLNTPDAEWYKILYCLSWKIYQPYAADYYNALYDFNQFPKKEADNPSANIETKEEATERIMKNRPTMDKNEPVIYRPEFKKPSEENVSPEKVAPGVPPKRSRGKKPKCFFALFKRVQFFLSPVDDQLFSLIKSICWQRIWLFTFQEKIFIKPLRLSACFIMNI